MNNTKPPRFKSLIGNLTVCASVMAGTAYSYGQSIENRPADQFLIQGANEAQQVENQSGNDGDARASSDGTTIDGTPNNDASATALRPTNDVISAAARDEEALATNRRAAQRSNIRAAIVETRNTSVSEENPFAPTGIQVGSLRLTSYFKQSGGYSSNKQSAALGNGGAFSFSEFNFQLRSQWGRHELAVNGNAEYENYFDRYIEPSPRVDIDGSLRLDLVDGFTATLGGNYGFEKEAATSTSLTTNAINEPGVHNFGVFGELQRSDRRIGVTLRASIDRSTYEDAKLAGGGLSSQEDRNVTNYAISSRLGYNTGLAYSPFIQGSITKSVFDLRVDRNGQQRDSLAFDLRGGIEIDISEKLNGEISAGYTVQEFADPALAALAGFVVEGELNWSPQRDTVVALTIGSNLGGSTTAGDSGAISYSSAVGVTHRIRDDLEFTAGVGVDYTNSEGLGQIDTTYAANVGFEYWLNRTLSLTADASYERQDSTSAGSTFDAGIVRLGVKVQR